MKKTVSILLLLCTVVGILPVSVFAQRTTESIEFADAYSVIPGLEILYEKPTGEVSEYGLAETAVYDKDGNVVNMEKQPATLGRGLAKTSNYPVSYNSMTVTNSVGVSIISRVKDQGNYGTCWAQAAASAAETVYLRNYPVEYAEFSDSHLAFFGNRPRTSDINDPTYGDGQDYADYLDIGGNNYVSGGCFARWSGPELDVYAPEPDWNTNVGNLTLNETNRYVAEQHIITNVLLNGRDVDTIKYYVQNFGDIIYRF